MTSNMRGRLARLENRADDPCRELPPLPDLTAVLDAVEPTRAEQTALQAARLEQLLSVVWVPAMAGDLRAADTATRLLDRQARLFRLLPEADLPAGGEVTAEDLMALIRSTPAA